MEKERVQDYYYYLILKVDSVIKGILYEVPLLVKNIIINLLIKVIIKLYNQIISNLG